MESSPSFFRDVMSSEYNVKVAKREMEGMAKEDFKVSPPDDEDEDTDDDYQEDFFDE